jgi:hypothetical protein
MKKREIPFTHQVPLPFSRYSLISSPNVSVTQGPSAPNPLYTFLNPCDPLTATFGFPQVVLVIN